THKTLRGPRGAMIFCKEEYKDAIDRGVFPGMQGGPHEHTIAGIAVALKEAMTPEFAEYAAQIIKNSHALADIFVREGVRLISGGTDNHLMLLDFRPFGPGRGVFVEKALEAAHINTNKSPIPNDPSPPFYPSGLRLGTPSLTIRGMKEKDMEQIGMMITKIVKTFVVTALPEEKTERARAVKEFSATLENHPVIQEVRAEVTKLASVFPVPGIDM
ncbi:MAG: serine hydroxymethyltransferase, partial [Candidatus Liptonbacteria bacterium]